MTFAAIALVLSAMASLTKVAPKFCKVLERRKKAPTMRLFCH
jgi:hypothetical protein